MSEEKTGFATTTYRFRVYDKHREWFVFTKQLYNQVLMHYYRILIEKEELLSLSNHDLLRELERLTVGTKEMKSANIKPEFPLKIFRMKIAEGEEEDEKADKTVPIPLYFRRSALNHAVSLMRTYVSLKERWQAQKEDETCKIKIGKPSATEEFSASPVYYKGMYKEFTEKTILLKLYDGKNWHWSKYRFTGRCIPKDGIRKSPTLVIEKKNVWLHVPVEMPVLDIRTVKERMKTEEKICAVSFPNQEVMAVCAILRIDGTLLESYFIRGGKELKHKRQDLLARLRISKESRGKKPNKEQDSKEKSSEENSKKENGTLQRENEQIFEAIQNLNEYYAHQVSRQIVSYCQDRKIAVIVVPNYKNAREFYKNNKAINVYEWQGRKIIQQLKYKAYQEGMVVTGIQPCHISDSCAVCGETIKKYNEGHRAGKNYYGGRLFFCPNGHHGNSALNRAVNTGRYFLQYFI